MKSQVILSAGSNARGQLSHGNEDDSHSFQPCLAELPPGSEVVCIAPGANHALLSLRRPDSNGKRELWGCGDGSRGQLGPNYQHSTQFRPIDVFERDIKFIASCWETSYVVLAANEEHPSETLVSMGANDFGDLGSGAPPGQGSDIPTVVDFTHLFPGAREITFLLIRAGTHHVAVSLLCTFNDLSSKRVLAGWGASRHGQLGSDASKQKFQTRPCLVSSDETITTFALGNQHTVVLHSTGQVSALGSNRKGQLSDMDGYSNVEAVDATWNGTYATSPVDDISARIMATGSNNHGQLATAQHVPGKVAWIPPTLSLGAGLTIKCGSEHVLVSGAVAPREDGSIGTRTVWGWGWNEHGNLGLGHTHDVKTPTQIWPPLSETTHGHLASQYTIKDVYAGYGTSWLVLETDNGSHHISQFTTPMYFKNYN